jgi:hypothetical protein
LEFDNSLAEDWLEPRLLREAADFEECPHAAALPLRARLPRLG